MSAADLAAVGARQTRKRPACMEWISVTSSITPRAEHALASFRVSDSASLDEAIIQARAAGGGTIVMDRGDAPYDIVLTHSNVPILFRPADPDAPPEIATLRIWNSSDIAVTGMDFRTGTADGRQDINIQRARNIELVDNTMKGVADGFVSETGTAQIGDSLMFLSASADITFAGNTVSDYFGGLGVLNSSGLRITDNEFTRLQGDGIQGGGLQDVVISGNYMHDFFGSTQSVNHSDMIQIWGAYTAAPSRDVTITGNFLDSGNGAATQGIFIRNEDFASDRPSAGYFENFTITDNVVHNGMVHGIQVSDVDGLTVQRNTVLWDKDALGLGRPGAEQVTAVPTIGLRNVETLTLTQNIAGEYSLPGLSDAALAGVGGNVTLNYADPTSAFYAFAHFANLHGGTDTDARDIAMRADSPLLGQFGAQLPLPVRDDAPLTGIIMRDALPGQPQAFRLTAQAVDAQGRPLTMDGLTARWTLPDGSVREGVIIEHDFRASGPQAVRLDLVDPQGTTASVTRQIDVPPPVLLRLDFDAASIRDTSGYDSPLTVIDRDDTALVDGREGGGFHLAARQKIQMSNQNAHLNGLDQFIFDLDVKQAQPDTSGAFLYLHTVFALSLTSTGAVQFRLTTDQGFHLVRSAADALGDGDWHNIKVRFDSHANRLALEIDGAVVDEVPAQGRTPAALPWGVELGGGWHAPADVIVDNVTLLSHEPPEPAPAPEPAPLPRVDLFDFAFDGDLQDMSDRQTVAKGSSGLVFDTRDGRTGVSVEPGSTAWIGTENDHLSSLSDFELEIGVAKNAGVAQGGVVQLHTIFDLDLLWDGSLRFWVQTDEGRFTVRSDRGVLAPNDADWHDIKVRYSNADETLELYLNGTLLDSTQASGKTAALSYWPLELGQPWGQSMYGTVDYFRMSTEAAAQFDAIA